MTSGDIHSETFSLEGRPELLALTGRPDRRLQKIRHYGFLSRRSNIDLDDVRNSILESLKDVEPDLELEAWTVPSLRPASHSDEDDGPRCPSCGGPLSSNASTASALHH